MVESDLTVRRTGTDQPASLTLERTPTFGTVAAQIDQQARWLFSPLPSNNRFDRVRWVPNAEPVNRKARRSRNTWPGGEFALDAPKSLELRIFDRLAAFKILTANVSMHMDASWRSALFDQLDFLLDPEDWDPSIPLPNETSYSTFLKLLIYLRPVERPSLGATDGGLMAANWLKSDSSLFVQFEPDSSLHWVVSRIHEGKREVVSGRTSIETLAPTLTAFRPEQWFTPVGR